MTGEESRSCLHDSRTRRCRITGSSKTLKVRTLGCARSSLPPTNPRPSSLRSRGRTRRTRNTERHEIYTGSGHRCGVIPYSSVWCGGLPLGLMMMSNTRKNSLARVYSWLGRWTAGRSSVALLSLSLPSGPLSLCSCGLFPFDVGGWSYF